jgi:hypothetical protein
MGIDISGLQKPKRIVGRHSFERCDEEDHYPVGPHRSLLDGWKPGCYVSEGQRFYLYVTNINFDVWQNALSQVFYDVPAREVQDHKQRYKGQPLVDVIAFPYTNNVGVGPKSSARLYQEFSQNARKAKRGFQRLAAEAAKRRKKGKKPKATVRSHAAQATLSLTHALGGIAVGGDDDPQTAGWEWKWETYRHFRRALKVASGTGIVLVSI